jgi:hypothetical protein
MNSFRQNSVLEVATTIKAYKHFATERESSSINDRNEDKITETRLIRVRYQKRSFFTQLTNFMTTHRTFPKATG